MVAATPIATPAEKMMKYFICVSFVNGLQRRATHEELGAAASQRSQQNR
jgi:hypothetical protein